MISFLIRPSPVSLLSMIQFTTLQLWPENSILFSSRENRINVCLHCFDRCCANVKRAKWNCDVNVADWHSTISIESTLALDCRVSVCVDFVRKIEKNPISTHFFHEFKTIQFASRKRENPLFDDREYSASVKWETNHRCCCVKRKLRRFKKKLAVSREWFMISHCSSSSPSSSCDVTMSEWFPKFSRRAKHWNFLLLL